MLLVQTVANPLNLEDEEGLIFQSSLVDGSGSGSGSGASEIDLIFDANSGDGSGSRTDEIEIFSNDASGDGSGSGIEEALSSIENNIDVFTTATTEVTEPPSTTTSSTTTTTTTENPIFDEEFLDNSLPTKIDGENIDLIDGSSTQTTTTTVEPTTTTTTSVEPTTTTTTTVEPTTTTTTTVEPSTSTNEITNEDANEGVQIIEEEEEIVISPGNYPARKVSKTVHQGPIKTRTRRHLDGDASDEDSFGFGDEMELFESDFGVQPGTEEQEEDILPRLTRSTNKAKSLLLVFLQNLF